MFRGSSTQLYVPAFTQKDFHYFVHTGLPTQGSSTEDFGQYNNREYTTPLSTNTISTLRGKAQPTQNPPHTRGVGTYPTQINHLTLEGFQHNLHLSLEGAKHLSLIHI